MQCNYHAKRYSHKSTKQHWKHANLITMILKAIKKLKTIEHARQRLLLHTYENKKSHIENDS